MEKKSFFVLLIMTPQMEGNKYWRYPHCSTFFHMICGRKRTQDVPIKLLFRVWFLASLGKSMLKLDAILLSTSLSCFSHAFSVNKIITPLSCNQDSIAFLSHEWHGNRTRYQSLHHQTQQCCSPKIQQKVIPTVDGRNPASQFETYINIHI